MIRLQISRDTGIRLHFLLEGLSYAAAAVIYLFQRRRSGDVVADPDRMALVAAAAAGAAVGSRALFWLCQPERTLHHLGDLSYLLGGKTIVGALLGGLLAVELVKLAKGIRTPTGDLYVLPLAAGIAIGRVGCFLAGPADATAGVATKTAWPWTVVYDDGIPRHPVALYEIAFVLIAAALLRRVDRRARPGLAFALFLASYLAFRLLVDFWKPLPPPLVFGLTAIQLACAAGLVYYAFVLPRRIRSGPEAR